MTVLPRLLAATMLTATPALAGNLKTAVNVASERANDLRGLAFAANGKLYASGHAGTANEATRTIVARFNADGSPDAGFGKGGFAEIDLAAGRQEGSLGVAELANGDVLVAVNAVDADRGQSVYLLRLDPAGNRRTAPAWGDAEGRVEVVFGWANADNEAFPGMQSPPQDTAWDLKVDRSGGGERVVVFGLGAAAKGSGRTDNDRYVTRLMAADGRPDPGFNGGKPVAYHSAGTFNDNARRGLVEADGAIVSAGYTGLGALGNHVVLIRLTAAGVPDSGFGNYVDPPSSGSSVGLTPRPGVAVFNPFAGNGGFAECYGVARLGDGSYVTTGYGGATGNGVASTLGYATTLAPDLVTSRAGAKGLDRSWGKNGTQAIQSEGKGKPSNEDRGRSLVALADGRTVQFGRYGGLAAAFVLTAKGELDSREDGDGILEFPHPTIDAQFFHAAVSADGRRIAAVTNAHEKGVRLVVLEVGD